jgi:hypothetical protein
MHQYIDKQQTYEHLKVKHFEYYDMNYLNFHIIKLLE